MTQKLSKQPLLKSNGFFLSLTSILLHVYEPFSIVLQVCWDQWHTVVFLNILRVSYLQCCCIMYVACLNTIMAIDPFTSCLYCGLLSCCLFSLQSLMIFGKLATTFTDSNFLLSSETEAKTLKIKFILQVHLSQEPKIRPRERYLSLRFAPNKLQEKTPVCGSHDIQIFQVIAEYELGGKN